jgi:hypothetical protein
MGAGRRAGGDEEESMREHLKFYIDGAWVDPATPRAHEVIDPATEEPIARISLGGQADVDRAVAARGPDFYDPIMMSLWVSVGAPVSVASRTGAVAPGVPRLSWTRYSLSSHLPLYITPVTQHSLRQEEILCPKL